MSLPTTRRDSRLRRRPRPRVSWGAAATSARLRADRRRALATLSALQPERAPTELEATLELVRDRLVAAGRPLLDGAARALAAAPAELEARGASIRAALEELTQGDQGPAETPRTVTSGDAPVPAEAVNPQAAEDDELTARDDQSWSRRAMEGAGRGTTPPERRVVPRGWLGPAPESEADGRPLSDRIPILAALLREDAGGAPGDRRASRPSERRREAAPRS